MFFSEGRFGAPDRDGVYVERLQTGYAGQTVERIKLFQLTTVVELREDLEMKKTLLGHKKTSYLTGQSAPLQSQKKIGETELFVNGKKKYELDSFSTVSNIQIVILGAGRPYRGNDPSSLVFTSGNQRVLDWVISAFDEMRSPDFHFVGGYRLDEIIKLYPGLHFSVNNDWQNSGSGGSLLTAPIPQNATSFVCYADIIFSKDVVTKLVQTPGDIIVVVDSQWKTRYARRSLADLQQAEKVSLAPDNRVLGIGKHLDIDDSDAEFAGIFKLSSRASNELGCLRTDKNLRRSDIPTLLMAMKQRGLSIRSVEIDGEWAELNQPKDIAHFVLGTKAETLERLRPLVRKCVIGELLRFTVRQWNTQSDDILKMIKDVFGKKQLVVRSSSVIEDSWDSSHAGQFRSVLNVNGASKNSIIQAVKAVIASYADKTAEHQILVQQMLLDVKLSGVITTRTLNHGAPYYTINYDEDSEATDTVTGGKGTSKLKTIVAARHSPYLSSAIPSDIRRTIEAANELEELVGYDALDIEFAISNDGQVHVFQLRPITIQHGYRTVSDNDVWQTLKICNDRFSAKQPPLPHIVAEKTCFGVMPDWNPAEIIGPKPRRLALSLYRYLITDEIWATQRVEYGYRDVRPQPILTTFAGHPYVDLRASFNSFIPAVLHDELASKLVTYYINRLEANRHLHDKIEFEVAFTCYTFDFDKKAETFLTDFTQENIRTLRKALLAITENGIRRCRSDFRDIDTLVKRYEMTVDANMAPLERTYVLLEDCKKFGTLSFSHLARGAFVAMAMLRSLEAAGVMMAEEKASFLNSLKTVTGQFERDGHRVWSGELSWELFVKKYSHLRPGTYDITSESYGANPEWYLRHMVRAPKTNEKICSKYWSQKLRSKIAKLLDKAGFSIDVEEFEDFLRKTIEGREYAKFIFTRNLSAAMEAIAEFGADYGLDREAISNIDVNDILSFCFETPRSSVRKDLESLLKREVKYHKISQVIELPSLIFHESNFWGFEVPQSQANFVTCHKIAAQIQKVQSKNSDLSGKIAVIPQADPGFDWLFGHDIAGLITMYGGANSHMTIRAAELDLPAAIGVGEKLYSKLAQSSLVELDCSARNIRIIQ